MNANNNKRIIGFDIARVASILVVVLCHSLGYGCIYYKYAVKTIGYASLTIFTFLSGFLLASRIDLQKCSFISFMKKRLLRIWPLFFISSVMLCLIGFNRWLPTVKAWFGLSSFWGPAPRTIWYVGMLIFLYAITLFWARGGVKRQIGKFLITMAIIAGMNMTVLHLVDSRLFFYAVVYFLGIIVGQYYYEKFFSFITKPKLVVAMLILFLAFSILLINRHNTLLFWGNALVGMVALLSLYVSIGEKWKDNKRLVSTVSMLSYASFCIYLFHREVFAFLLMIWRPACQYQLVPYLAILGLAIVIPLAYYIQKGYDRIIKKS